MFRVFRRFKHSGENEVERTELRPLRKSNSRVQSELGIGTKGRERRREAAREVSLHRAHKKERQFTAFGSRAKDERAFLCCRLPQLLKRRVASTTN